MALTSTQEKICAVKLLERDTTLPAQAETPVPPSPDRAHRRRAVIGVAVLAGGGLLGLGAWLSFSGSPHEHSGHHERAGGVLERPVGQVLRAKVKGGSGEVHLRMSAEVPAPAPKRLTSAMAGAPLELSLDLSRAGAAAGKSRPKVIAHRIETSLAAALTSGAMGGDEQGGGAHHGGGASDAGGADHHGGGASDAGGADHHGGKLAEGARPGQGPGGPAADAKSEKPAYAETLSLDRSETFLFSRRSGQLVAPNGGAGENHDHATGEKEAGQGLASTIQGGGFRAAVSLAAGAAATAVDDEGRFLVAAYPGKGQLEIADLMRHERVGTLAIGGRPGKLAFAPDGRLWVADEDADRMVVVDVAGRRKVAGVAVGQGPKSVTFEQGGKRALVATQDSATLVDARSLRKIGSAKLKGRSVAAVYSPRARAFAVAQEDGTVLTLPLGPAGLGRPREIGLGANAGTSALVVGPDGRTAVAANADANTLAVLDLVKGKMVKTVDAGRAPSELVVLDHFAVARNAGSGELTWVDIDEPSRSNNIPLAKSPATSLALRPGGKEAVAAVPGDNAMVGLHVMMGRPMVMEQVQNTVDGDVVLASAGGLKRTGTASFEQRTVIERPGIYDVEVRVPGGGTANFEIPVAELRAAERTARPERTQVRGVAGRDVKLRFRVSGKRLDDAQVLAFSTGGVAAQVRAPARPIGSGRYEATLRRPPAGSYRVVLLSESAGLRSGGRAPSAKLEVRRRVG